MPAISSPSSQTPASFRPVYNGQADRVAPLLNSIFTGYKGPAFSVRFWDDSTWRSNTQESYFQLFLRTQDAWRALSSTPDEVSLGEKYVMGEIDVEGDLFLALRALPLLERSLEAYLSSSALALRAATRRFVGQASRALHLGSVHCKRRDAASIAHHYDKPAEFYQLFLGPSMVYSCAYFRDWNNTLDQAQSDKMDMICRKLGLRAGDRFLDIGCGWGSLVLHAAQRYAVSGHGISLSGQQVDFAGQRIATEGPRDRIKIYCSDYRDLGRSHMPFDKMASVGMCEHVGRRHIDTYFREAYKLLLPGGLFLNHGITRSIQVPAQGPSFVDQYVFPDGELLPLTEMVRAAEAAGFEVRDVQDLREHYEATLHCWVDALCRNERKAVQVAGFETVRTWKLYMAGSAEAFRRGDIAVHQLLLSKHAAGYSAAEKVRERWYATA